MLPVNKRLRVMADRNGKNHNKIERFDLSTCLRKTFSLKNAFHLDKNFF